MWPSAECISSLLVQTPSLQLGVLQNHYEVHSRLVRSLPLTLSKAIPLVETRVKSSPVRHQATTAQVGHKGVNPFTLVHVGPTMGGALTQVLWVRKHRSYEGKQES